jgi:hypothetical protein
LALGFLATTARSDVLTLSLPAHVVPGLVDALEHLRPSSGPLVAHRHLVGELLTVAIDEVGERIGTRSTGLLRGEASVGDLRAPLAELGGLLDLYEGLEA